MLTDILSKIITDTFDEKCRPFNLGKEYHASTDALVIDWRHPVVFVDDGGAIAYPHTEMLIWGPHNYIGVFTRFFPDDREDREYHEDWKCHTYHDSVWRETINRWIFDHRETLNHVGFCLDKWYKQKPLCQEDQKFFRDLANSR